MVAATGYRVLARTYRPKTFSTLIGQEVMVQTLANAIALNRLPHAIMLTGVRGVGKTTTARLIAKALNCVGADGMGTPTIDPCGVCEHCVNISEDRHLDVQEIDAASHTKVEEIRKIFDGVAYQPVAARYRIYIVDEVHMLSGHSFNALLKTLEEPPPHVKFLFATTEIRKVPVTILSRCMRFSLRRVEVPVLAGHLQEVAQKEQVGLESSAATLLAKAAEGSVRDSLSLLDQAIALSSTEMGIATINDTVVRQMLGLAAGDGLQQVLAAILQGQPHQALTHFGQLYAAGSEPLQLLQDLLHLVYQLTRGQLLASSEGEEAGEDLPPLLPILTELAAMPLLTRAWQLLLKGIDEVQQAPNAFEAAEMILVRLAYASTLPTPYELMRGQQLQMPTPAAAPAPTAKTARAPKESAATPVVAEVASVVSASDTASATSSITAAPIAAESSPPADAIHAAPAALAIPAMPVDYAQLVEMLADHNPLLASQLRQNASLVLYEPPLLRLHMPTLPPSSWWQDLEKTLRRVMPADWLVQAADAPGGLSLKDQAEAEWASLQSKIADNPDLQQLQQGFPDLSITDIKSSQGG